SEADTTGDVLSGLADAAPTAEPEPDTTGDVLSGLADAAPTAEPEPDTTGDVLSGLADAAPTAEPEPDTTSDVLSGLAVAAPTAEPEPDTTRDVLSGLADAAPTAEPEPDTTGDVLSGLADAAPTAEPEADTTGDVLSGLADAAPTAEPEPDPTGDVLDGLTKTEAAAAAAEVEAHGSADKPSDPVGELGREGVSAFKDNGIEETAEPPTVTTEGTEVAPADDAVFGDAGEEVNTAFAEGSNAGAKEGDAASDLDALLGDLDSDEPAATGVDGEKPPDAEVSDAATLGDDLDDLLGDLDSDVPGAAGADGAPPDAEDSVAVTLGDDLDDLLGDLDSDVPDAAGADGAPPDAEDSVAVTLGDDLDDLLGDLDSDVPDAAGAGDAPPDAEGGDDLDDLLGDLDPEGGSTSAESLRAEASEADATSDLDDLLGELDVEGDASRMESASVTAVADGLDDLLGDLTSTDDAAASDVDVVEEAAEVALSTASDLDDLLADLDEDCGDARDGPASGDDGLTDLDDLLADLDAPEESGPPAATASEPPAEPSAGVPDEEAAAHGQEGTPEMKDDLEPQDGDLADLDSLLADLEGSLETIEEDPEAPASDALSELDDLLNALDAEAEAETEEDPGAAAPESDDLDALLAGLDEADDAAETTEEEASAEEDATAEDASAVEETAASDLDDLLAGAVGGTSAAAAPVETGPRQAPYGTVSAPRPDRDSLNRKTFRIAIFGDFTGRAARGLVETGDALAQRKAIPLDVDDIEETIEGFATTLMLPIGKDGAGIEVKLGEFDDLEPDELYDNVEIFEELSGLRQQLGMGSMASRAIERLKAWGAEYDKPIRLPKRSSSTSIPADRKLSDFQALIGDTAGRLTQASPLDEMIAQIVGPYAVKAPDDGVAAMTAAVDEALSGAMRLVLHHPDFQAVEAQWRTLDLLARRIETDAELELVLYDVSAEELAIDLAAQEDLSQSGLFGLLTSVLDPEEGRGGFSALFGLYTFEETPPHAELLGRIAQVAAHVDAPFVTALSPGYLEVEPQDRHPLVAKAWDALKGMPEASYLGLASPRFMLRLPYGKKTEPISAFDFEEFTPAEGLSGMLWANPAALVAILLAGTYKEAGKPSGMSLGSMMSLDDVPFYFITDQHGDQVALPCTERNLTAALAQASIGRGIMPVLSMKGRNEIRLGSFRAVSGAELAGAWSAEVPPASSASGNVGLALEVDIEGQTPDTPAEGAPAPSAPAEDGDDDMSLDDLLAGFGDDTDDDGGDDDDMDPELAELLKGL
ncbi:MAG: type VI secretion system contractile sheath large subunit, partial [Pseudomonadota bacterium]